MMLKGQEEAVRAYLLRGVDRYYHEEANLEALYKEAYENGQGVLADKMRQAKDRCPQCGSENGKKGGV